MALPSSHVDSLRALTVSQRQSQYRLRGGHTAGTAGEALPLHLQRDGNYRQLQPEDGPFLHWSAAYSASRFSQKLSQRLSQRLSEVCQLEHN